jgi:hypothetical protein
MDHDRAWIQFRVAELIKMCKRAGDLFMNGTLPIGDEKQTSTITSAALVDHRHAAHYCRLNAKKILTATR